MKCPSGTAVVSSDTAIAGVYYLADRYKCQSCPDTRMTMSYSNSVYTCTCPTGAIFLVVASIDDVLFILGYTLTGVSSIGPQQCVLTSLASTYEAKALQSAAVVNYYVASTTVSSLTLLHYFVTAASYCSAYGGPQDTVYCQQLANLCVLQLYDDTTDICQAYSSILSSRGSLTNDVNNWGRNLPWITYSTTFGATVICQDNGYKATVNLNKQALKYIAAEFALNGTFLGYRNLQTLFRSESNNTTALCFTG